MSRYTRVYWQNFAVTPIDANNLNIMDKAIESNANLATINEKRLLELYYIEEIRSKIPTENTLNMFMMDGENTFQFSRGFISEPKGNIETVSPGNQVTIKNMLSGNFSQFKVGDEVTLQNDVQDEDLIILSTNGIDTLTFTTTIQNTYAGFANVYRSNVKKDNGYKFGQIAEGIELDNRTTPRDWTFSNGVLIDSVKFKSILYGVFLQEGVGATVRKYDGITESTHLTIAETSLILLPSSCMFISDFGMHIVGAAQGGTRIRIYSFDELDTSSSISSLVSSGGITSASVANSQVNKNEFQVGSTSDTRWHCSRFTMTSKTTYVTNLAFNTANIVPNVKVYSYYKGSEPRMVVTDPGNNRVRIWAESNVMPTNLSIHGFESYYQFVRSGIDGFAKALSIGINEIVFYIDRGSGFRARYSTNNFSSENVLALGNEIQNFDVSDFAGTFNSIYTLLKNSTAEMDLSSLVSETNQFLDAPNTSQTFTITQDTKVIFAQLQIGTVNQDDVLTVRLRRASSISDFSGSIIEEKTFDILASRPINTSFVLGYFDVEAVKNEILCIEVVAGISSNVTSNYRIGNEYTGGRSSDDANRDMMFTIRSYQTDLKEVVIGTDGIIDSNSTLKTTNQINPTYGQNIEADEILIQYQEDGVNKSYELIELGTLIDVLKTVIRIEIDPADDITALAAYLTHNGIVGFSVDALASIVDPGQNENFEDLTDTPYDVGTNVEVASLGLPQTPGKKVTLKYILERINTTDDITISKILGGVS